MTTSPLDKEITTPMLLKFATPTVLSMIFMEVFSIIDGLFVVRFLGTDALSALNITFPLISIMVAISAMFGSGGNALVARQLGQKREKDAKQNFSLIVWMALAAGIVLTVLILLSLRHLMYFFGSDDQLFPYCYDWAYTYSFFIPLTLFTCVFPMFYITQGKAFLGMLFSSLGGVTHIALDYVFIVIFNMGIKGAALACGIGYALVGVIGFVYFAVNRRGNIYFVRPKFRPYVLAKTCMNGVSEMVTNLSICIVTILFNNVVIRLAGPDGVAAITVIFYMQTALLSTCFGYSIGISSLISFNYGKAEWRRLKQIYTKSVGMLSFISLAAFAFCFFKADLLIRLFLESGTSVYQMAVEGSRLFAFCFLFMGLNVFASALFTALSNGRISAILSFFRTFLFLSVALLILPVFWKMNGVWLAVPVSEGLSFIMAIYYGYKYKAFYHFI